MHTTIDTGIEDFPLNWKDKCGKLIIKHTAEKMEADYKKTFSKQK
jgi:hypothetical protein